MFYWSMPSGNSKASLAANIQVLDQKQFNLIIVLFIIL